MIMRTSTSRKDTIVTKTAVYWWITITCLTILGKTGKCMATCPTVQQTVRWVQRCPMNEAEWKNAAMNKKCGQLHRNCTSPFKYHCALNVFLNETWEVCAPGRYLLGYCIEYNELGNRIQDNYMRDCSAMIPPCPPRYKSTEAYRYQVCYQTVKPSPDIYQTTPSSTHTTMFSNTDTKSETNEETDNENIIWIAVLPSCFGISVVIFIVVIISMVRRRYSMTKNPKKKEMNKVELRPLNGTSNGEVLTI